MELQGNHQELRNVFYFFRESIHKKHLNVRLKKSDIIFFNNVIKPKKDWNMSEAYRLYEILKPFLKELNKLGCNYKDIEPKFKSEPKLYNTPSLLRKESILYKNGLFIIYFNYSNEKLEDVRNIEGRKYCKDNKHWEVPMSSLNSVKNFSEKYKIPTSESCERVIYDFQNNLEQSYKSERIDLGLNLKLDLYDYQTVGVDYSVRVKRAWIADQMGLGKSFQAISYGVKINNFPFIIICPKSLRLNWKNEIEVLTNKKALIADHKKMKYIHRYVELGQVDFLIMNYEGAKSFFVKESVKTGRGLMIKLNGKEKLFKGIIIDESHELRNIKASRTKIIKKLCDNYDYRLLLTGSPFVNRVSDLATQLNLLGWLNEFGGYKKFLNDYEDIKYVGKRNGKKKKLSELNNKLRSLCMIRREKHQVLKELPDKVRQIISIDISNRKEYDNAMDDFAKYLKENGVSEERIDNTMSAAIITKIMYLRKICLRGKIDSAKEYIKNILNQGEKLVVFCWHLETIELLREHFPNLMEISGNVKDEKVEESKRKFQDPNNKEANLFIITYKRGGTGHTLTESSNVLFMELGWNPKDQEQAEDRTHRIGQKNNVTCHYFIGKDTIEEWMYNLIESKRKNSKKSLDSTEQIKTDIQKDLILKLVKNANKNI